MFSISRSEACAQGFLKNVAVVALLTGVSIHGHADPLEPFYEPRINYNDDELRAAQEQQSLNPHSIGISNISLNPGGNMVIPGPFTLQATDFWVNRGAVVDYTTVGATGGSTAPWAYASATAELLEKGTGATQRSVSARAELTYFVEIGLGPPIETDIGPIFDLGYVPVQVVSHAFRKTEQLQPIEYGYGTGTLTLKNRTTDLILIDYSTDDDPVVGDSAGSTQPNRFEFDTEISVFDVLEVNLQAEAYAVVDNSIDPDAVLSASAEVYVDPYFLFDEEAYDNLRALDPALPDVELADIFTFQVSGNIYQEPAVVPVPASWLMFGAAAGLLGLRKRHGARLN